MCEVAWGGVGGGMEGRKEGGGGEMERGKEDEHKGLMGKRDEWEEGGM